jgi:hypothetical protein
VRNGGLLNNVHGRWQLRCSTFQRNSLDTHGVASSTSSSALLLAVLACALPLPALAADDLSCARSSSPARLPAPHELSRWRSGRDEAVIFERRIATPSLTGILGKGTSRRIAESLGLSGDLSKASQCNVCHAPVQGVARSA